MTDAGQRITAGYVEWLAERCTPRDTDILRTVNRLRLASGNQLERLHFAELNGRSRSVTRWRVLKRLADWRLIAPLARRVGGGSSGSAGTVFALDTAGARLLRQIDSQRIRRPTTPGERKTKHSLAVSEVYTGLVEMSRTNGFSVARFEVEPRYPAGAGWISPDAYALLVASDVYDHWWIEVDRATESVATVGRKIAAYTAFYRQGRWADLGIMPRVLLAVPDEGRRSQLFDNLAHLPDAKSITEIVLQRAASQHMSLTLATTHS